MKKLIYCAAALAAMIFAASCQQENLEPVAQENTVTYTVELPDAQTKGFMGTVSKVDELVYEVWKTEKADERDLNGTTDGKANATLLYQKTVPMVNQRTVITLNLVQDQEYTVLFWAQKSGTGVYNTEALTDVHYAKTWEGEENDANCLYSNQESYEAYYATEFISDGDKKSRTVVLKRPFAQLNLGTRNTQMENTNKEYGEGEYNVEVVSSKVTVSNVGTHFNVANNYVATPTTEGNIAVSEPASMIFETAADPSNAVDDETSQFEYITVGGQQYEYVAMNYLFATGANVTVSYEINTKLSDKNGNNTTDAKVTNTVYQVPLQENYRTNIVGNLLTSETEYEVIVDKEWAWNDGDTPNWDGNIVEVWNGTDLNVPEVEIDETTGETTYVVETPSELAYLAALVNGTLTSTFATKADTDKKFNITLNGDVDLNNMQWTAIGTETNNFTGSFNGNGHTIRNLKISVSEGKEGKAYLGFFGYAKDATIQNVVFENVDVNIACLDIDHSQGHIGAVVGSLEGTSTIENVTVKGDVKVEATFDANGASRVAVVAGGNAYGNVTMKNVHVIANEGSYLKANNNTGALAGQLQGKNVFENCSSNIDVTVKKFFAGGIIGLAAGDSQFTDCHTTGNVTVTAGREGRIHDHYRVGGIAGGWADGAKNVCTLTVCSYKGEISGTNADGSVAESFDYAGFVGRGYTLNGCAGSKVVIDGVEYVQVYNTAAEAGIYYVNGAYTITSVAQFKAFAAKVNAGETFEGKTVKLANDIDLNNEEWTPIGSATADHGFMGNFDGNGKAIKNLKMTQLTPDADNYVYAGLFGVTEGISPDQQNYIKNLTIENVTIETKGHIAAAAIAYPYYTEVENVTVKGNISIKGGHYTSGALAYTRRCVDAKDITVEGNEGSLIEGDHTVGGVISDIQMNGGLKANYSNFAASGLTIKGNMYVGGISGIIAKQTLNGATVKNVNLVCEDIRTGIVAGATGGNATLEKVSYENVTGATHLIGASYNGTEISVATADELIAALDAGMGVLFENDITVAATKGGYNKAGILQNNAQTIDGNGHTLTVTGAGATWDCAIYTNGGLIKNLTVAGAMRGIFTAGQSADLKIDNVEFKNVIYTFNSDGKMPTNPFGVYVSNSKVNGWTSHSDMHTEVVYTNCSFGEGSGYKYCRPYGTTSFVNCTFCPGYNVDDSKTTAISYTNCTWEE